LNAQLEKGFGLLRQPQLPVKALENIVFPFMELGHIRLGGKDDSEQFSEGLARYQLSPRVSQEPELHKLNS
jgi:hypothetical protein